VLCTASWNAASWRLGGVELVAAWQGDQVVHRAVIGPVPGHVPQPRAAVAQVAIEHLLRLTEPVHRLAGPGLEGLGEPVGLLGVEHREQLGQQNLPGDLLPGAGTGFGGGDLFPQHDLAAVLTLADPARAAVRGGSVPAAPAALP
jgi:hypothetical protein